MLDVVDFGANPQAPEFARLGVLYVRHGKAMKGSAPKQRSVLACSGGPPSACRSRSPRSALRWRLAGGRCCGLPSERGSRVGETRIDENFRSIRRELGLPMEQTFHSLRRSYVTHLIEEGFDPRFVQEQVGHEHASTTSIYTCVSSDFRTRSLRAALDRAIGPLSLDVGKEGRS
ncbi:MAG TPA: tyrosine-type recombinase/integrase [Acidimicrobiales bacterium]|nr:tyrosine-type recombinase/integrase [Acidimicrobiales bacterium]